MTTELVGPLPTIRFQDGTKQAYDVPKDTCDPRWRGCTVHRPACDCREAERSEEISELRAQLREAADAARDILAGHAIWAYEDGPNGEREVGCMCTGCQIVRAAWLLPHAEGSSMTRDETDGLTDWQQECEMRWKVCVGRCPNLDEHLTRPEGRCGYITRDRGHFHEHMTRQDGTLERAVDPEWAPW
ncbi:hypothetical protein [Dactylosporangium sp. CA-139066]|uniref:hypothetical protein n=1 Tax=Dactylosporangium sp. CA-139066 TaxID=3239930 RepID=UPI003D8E9CEC